MLYRIGLTQPNPKFIIRLTRPVKYPNPIQSLQNSPAKNPKGISTHPTLTR